MNATELARNKFNALFAAHDARDMRSAAEEPEERLDHMTSENKCKVKDDLVNQLIALNGKLNTLSPTFLRSERARAEVQERRETLYVEIKLHKAKGHNGKPCPARI